MIAAECWGAKTGQIKADLVYTDQAEHQVGMLLNPEGGIYISFECGSEIAEGKGPFLSPVTPVNREATSFMATLSQLYGVQTPGEYENEAGELVQAIPTGAGGGKSFVPTAVETVMTVSTSVPVEIKAVATQEIESAQHEEEANKQAETLKKYEEALKSAEEHAKQLEEEAKTKLGG